MLLPTLAHVTTLAETAKHSPLTGEARRPELGGHAAGLKVVVVGISVAVVMSTEPEPLCESSGVLWMVFLAQDME